MSGGARRPENRRFVGGQGRPDKTGETSADFHRLDLTREPVDTERSLC